MKYQNEIETGKKAEDDFMAVAFKRGFNPIESSQNENIHNHIDVHLRKDGKSFSFDVKAMKKLSREDSASQDKYVFVEFKNVKGNKGWLYGSADFIVFETVNSFYVVHRKSLATYCEINVEREFAYSAKHCLYKLYRRNGRKDLISMIELDKIPKEFTKVWEK